MLVSCKNCAKDFEKGNSEAKLSPNHFCTRSCAAVFNNKSFPKRKPNNHVCKVCKNTFTNTKGHRSVSYCAPCRALDYSAKNVTIGEYRNKLSVKGKHPSWLHSHIRVLNKSWNKGLGTICQKCKYFKHIEFAHIKGISTFEDHVTIGEVNAPENNLVLCRNCHWEFDNGLFPLEDVPPRENQVTSSEGVEPT